MCLSLAARFGNARVGVVDSLVRNAYGIYVVHYAFVTWLQYFLLPASLPGVVKFVGVL